MEEQLTGATKALGKYFGSRWQSLEVPDELSIPPNAASWLRGNEKGSEELEQARIDTMASALEIPQADFSWFIRTVQELGRQEIAGTITAKQAEVMVETNSILLAQGLAPQAPDQHRAHALLTLACFNLVALTTRSS